MTISDQAIAAVFVAVLGLSITLGGAFFKYVSDRFDDLDRRIDDVTIKQTQLVTDRESALALLHRDVEYLGETLNRMKVDLHADEERWKPRIQKMERQLQRLLDILSGKVDLEN